jgi:aminomuconate-semialdehyde/2-hydroxymuconate-6-semialdehyde dehydrogenase
VSARLEVSNYIDGRLQPPATDAWLEIHEPATGRVSGRVADSGAHDLEQAVAAARQAFPAWRRAGSEARARWLHALAELVAARAEQLALAESADTGKPLSLARDVDIPRVAANLRFFAAAATQFASESHPMGDAGVNFTLREPLGIVGCISPWNLPLYLLTWKIAPALAAGNCVIAKPSELTPVTAGLFAELCMEAGLPPGVLNILHGRGPGIGELLVAHPEIRAISFTGGTRTGALIAQAVAPQFKKLSLELGGKNPTIVFADCDFERTVDGVVRAAFTNQGQVCMCGSRILVERALYARFRDAVVARTRALRVGDPAEPGTDQGALISAAHRQKVLDYLALAREEGARVLCGGETVTPPGERCRDGLVRGSDPAREPRPGLPHEPGGNLRPGGDAAAVRRRGRGGGARQRRALRPRGLDLEPRRRPLPPRRGARRGRPGLGELLDGARPAHAPGRHQGIRPRPRGRLRGHALLHRAEECLRELRMT